MKKGIVVSIALIVAGLVIECVNLVVDAQFFSAKLWILGIFCLLAGVMGVFWLGVVPLLEERASKVGQFKKQARRNR